MPFVAKDEPVAVFKTYIPIAVIRFRRKEPETFGRKLARFKCLPVVMMMHIQRVPVIHTTSFKMLIRDRESERMDKMQAGLRDRTKPTDITGVLRNFRIEEDDVKHDERTLNIED